MAVTIDEMHVDVASQPVVPSNAATGGEEPKKKVDLQTALEIMRERNMRLKAD